MAAMIFRGGLTTRADVFGKSSVLPWQQEVLELARFDGFWLKEGRPSFLTTEGTEDTEIQQQR